MRVQSLSRRLASAAVVLMVGAGAAACGSDSTDAGSSSSSSTDEATDGGAEESEEFEDAAAEEESSAPAEALAELSVDDFYPTVMGALQEAESFTFTSTSGSLGTVQEMTGQARFGDDGVEMAASSTGAQAMELILLDQTMYLRSPDLGTGDKWAKIDLSDPNSLFGMIGKATDPEVMFKALEEPKKLELIGSEDVAGVATNHYRITMDPTRYLEAMNFPAAMADMLPPELVTEMWVDADNLPRKFAQTVEIAAMGGGQPTTSTTEGTYSDFGTDVEIEAPPADEVTENFPGA